jgi:uncharacterized protein (AIM24 family)
VPGFELVNSKVVRARVSRQAPVLARRGAMLGYSGDVRFSPAHVGHGQGGGAGRGPGGGLSGLMAMAGRAMAGESAPLMATEGDGEVLYGYAGLHVSLVRVDPSRPLTVEADRLLAYDTSLSSAVLFLGQGGLRAAARGAMTGQGLFTTQLTGSGDAALLSHGGAIALQVDGGRQVTVDPQAYVGHVGVLSVDIAASVGWRDAVGRGSGEAVQLKVSGTGTVWVQASEQKF